jgi:hypothetical protein
MASTPKKVETPAPDEASDLVHVLKKPVPSFGENLTELRFREPTGSDITHVGVPVILDMANDPPRVLHDAPKMSAMMARLSNVSPQTIAAMSPQDWVSCAWLLTPFFVPAPGTI